jgi:hypothetical protein
LKNIVREELNQRIVSINLHKKIDIQEDKEDIVIANISNNLFDDQHNTELSVLLVNTRTNTLQIVA